MPSPDLEALLTCEMRAVCSSACCSPADLWRRRVQAQFRGLGRIGYKVAASDQGPSTAKTAIDNYSCSLRRTGTSLCTNVLGPPQRADRGSRNAFFKEQNEHITLAGCARDPACKSTNSAEHPDACDEGGRGRDESPGLGPAQHSTFFGLS